MYLDTNFKHSEYLMNSVHANYPVLFAVFLYFYILYESGAKSWPDDFLEYSGVRTHINVKFDTMTLWETEPE
jgi:hypothetical protein